MNFDIYKSSLGKDKDGKEVFLKDIWPSNKEIEDLMLKSINADMFIEDIQMFQKDLKNGEKLKQ